MKEHLTRRSYAISQRDRTLWITATGLRRVLRLAAFSTIESICCCPTQLRCSPFHR